MSVAVNKVIYSTLSGNAGLVALLATDPRDNGPAIYYAKKSETPPVYAQITFRECVINPIAKLGTITADQEYYDFEVWTNTRLADGVSTVFEAMDPLLHRQRLAPVDGTHDFLWQTLRIPGGSPAIYDNNLKAWFGLYRYQFLHCRF